MNSAEYVVGKFGGQSALASMLGKGQSTVQYWVKTGMVPVRWHAQLLELAAKHGIDLSPADFLPSEIPANAGDPESGTPEMPMARWYGSLDLGGETELPCYVLADGRRVISRAGVTSVLTDGKGGGSLHKYLAVEGLSKVLPDKIELIEFSLENVVNKQVMGMEAETFLEICRAYVTADRNGDLTTERQRDIAKKAAMFLAACAKVGLIALIDEATGYQYERPYDALKLKLKLYLEEEMRQWEKTFPDQLWQEFGRLTGWKGSVHQRPKYWGKLVMELVYGYLDRDVADWLKKHAPTPTHGQNYHQWLTGQYGLKKLMEHLWMLIGLAKACNNMSELRDRMAQMQGREMFQFRLPFPYERKPGQN